jgi:hypothetical protein
MDNFNKAEREKLLALNPTKLGEIINSEGQLVEFFEDPIYGGDGFVLGKIGNVLFSTGFYDLGDFFAGSDYLPVLLNTGAVICEFEKSEIF